MPHRAYVKLLDEQQALQVRLLPRRLFFPVLLTVHQGVKCHIPIHTRICHIDTHRERLHGFTPSPVEGITTPGIAPPAAVCVHEYAKRDADLMVGRWIRKVDHLACQLLCRMADV